MKTFDRVSYVHCVPSLILQLAEIRAITNESYKQRKKARKSDKMP
jgi:hypothetical protein